jgi:N6-L-threonylcarbamoyladenine synthase
VVPISRPVLGIETSCDETSAALLRDGRELLSNIISSQMEIHREYGGVVPELASRKHVESILPVIDEAFTEAEVRKGDVSAVSVTYGPGLVGALVVGLSVAKALAYAWGVPLLGVHHLEAHIYANFVEAQREFPLVCLVVSGGHTEIVLMKGHGDLVILGRTRDDAAGEAFDKVARVLGLEYPGGPAIDRMAAKGDEEYLSLRRSHLEEGSLDFSFSGIKTAVAYLVNDLTQARKAIPVAHIAASFRRAVVDVLVDKTMAAAERHGVKSVFMAGGVAANSLLREEMLRAGASRGLEVSFPPANLCTDNAAMVACAGHYLLNRGLVSDLSLDAEAGPELGVRG